MSSLGVYDDELCGLSQELAHVMASGCTPVFSPESSVVLAVIETPVFMAVLIASGVRVLSVRANGVDSCFFRCGSAKSTLVPDGFSTTELSWANEFLKRESSFDCMAQELSACSLPIVSILVSRFHNFSFTVSYRFFISSKSFLKCFSRSLSVASTLSDNCCSFSSVALARLKQLSRFSFLLYRISLFSYWRSPSLYFSFLSICSNFAIKSPSSSEIVFSG